MLAFPLGKLNKSDVRQIALNNNLKVDISKESQDFYAGNYSELLKFDERIGEILHENGTKMGIHKGIWNFTIGQRKGIGISHPTPLYVTRLDAVKNIIYVGEKEYLNTHSFKLKDIHYMHSYKLSINDEFTVKTRSSGIEVSCTISGINMNEIEVELHASPGAIAPGQSAVFYSKEIVEFGGVIY